MRFPRYVIFLAIGSLVLAGVVLLLVLDPNGPSEYVAIGLLLGTMYSYATLAATWNALGPLPLFARLPLSLAWLVAVVIGIAINLGWRGGPNEVLVIGGLLIGQWLLLQLPFWGLAIFYGLRIRHVSERRPRTDMREHQFGIRQVMIVTAIVAVVLGIGRVLITDLAGMLDENAWQSKQIADFTFLAVAAIAMTVPLVLAALLARFAWVATPIVLLVAGLATWWEFPLLTQMTAGPGGGPDAWHLAYINAFSMGWVLVIAGLLRLGGYQLTTPLSILTRSVSEGEP